MTVDLNLLRYLIAVIEEKSVKNAALSLGVTSSAVSQNISKLNTIYNEVLFTRSNKVLKPTAAAMSLYNNIKPAIDEVESHAISFKNPLKSKRTILFSSHKDIDILYYPRLQALLKESNYDIELINTETNGDTRRELEDLLYKRSVDFVVSTHFLGSHTFHSDMLLEERLVAMCRKGHPYSDQLENEKVFAAQDFILLNQKSDNKYLLETLYGDEMSSRNAVYYSESMLSSMHMVSQSDLVCVVTEEHATQFKDMFSLEVHPLPYRRDAKIPIYVSYRSSTENDKAVSVVISLIKQICSDLKHKKRTN